MIHIPVVYLVCLCVACACMGSLITGAYILSSLR